MESSFYARPEDAAQIALDTYHNGESYQLPIDPVVIARTLGINVFSTKLENGTSGMIAKLESSPDSDIDMILNSEHAPVRQRFTCAHEIGHFFTVLRDNPSMDKGFLYKRDELSSCGTNQDEIYANKFAAELLMPTSLVKQYVDEGHKMGALTRMFNVSIQAMTNRLDTLRLRAEV